MIQQCPLCMRPLANRWKVTLGCKHSMCRTCAVQWAAHGTRRCMQCDTDMKDIVCQAVVQLGKGFVVGSLIQVDRKSPSTERLLHTPPKSMLPLFWHRAVRTGDFDKAHNWFPSSIPSKRLGNDLFRNAVETRCFATLEFLIKHSMHPDSCDALIVSTAIRNDDKDLWNFGHQNKCDLEYQYGKHLTEVIVWERWNLVRFFRNLIAKHPDEFGRQMFVSRTIEY